MPNDVHEAITDSVTQVNTQVVGDTPATAMGNLMMATSQALGVAAQNLTMGQQQANIMWQAATVQGINALMNTGNAVTGTVSGRIIGKGQVPVTAAGQVVSQSMPRPNRAEPGRYTSRPRG